MAVIQYGGRQQELVTRCHCSGMQGTAFVCFILESPTVHVIYGINKSAKGYRWIAEQIVYITNNFYALS